MQKQQRGLKCHQRHKKEVEGREWGLRGTERGWQHWGGGEEGLECSTSARGKKKKKSLNLQCPISGRQSGKGLIRAAQRAPAPKPLPP